MNHSEMRRALAAGAAATAICLLTSACGGGGPAAGGGKISGDKVTLGVVTDLSGVYASLTGPGAVEAVKMAADDYKKKYGDKAVAKNIEVLSADHQNKPEVASTKARELYDRKSADALFDVPTSSAALAVQTIAGQSRKMYFNVGAATPELTGKACNPYTYAWAYDAYMLAHGTGATVTTEGAKDWYLIYPDYAFGEAMSSGFEASIKAAGGRVVKKDPTPFPNDNFSTFLLKAKSTKPKPQVLGVMHAGGDLVNAVKQYDQFKLKQQGIGLALGLISDTDIASIGADKLEGAKFTTAWWWNKDDRTRAFADEFKERTGKRPSFDHAGNYSAATQYLEAIQRAGTDDPDKVRGELDGMTFSDVFAQNATVREGDHRVTHDAYLAQVKKPGTEPTDTTELVRTIPAAEAFAPVSKDCKLS
ncbi:ABC transporter substrate-binding protein [Streptomyces sp. NPDC001820]|uniref:ABC transporter substrate-binding protein n=1 Tax=Streptomyces sp. NPDC001820 TaxID=3364613 RepID=UPI00369171F5